MKCCSRSMLGVIIGSLNVLAYVILIIGSIVGLVMINEKAKANDIPWHSMDIPKELIAISTILLIVLIVGCIISALLIVGIVKRRHRLMLPWLILSCIGFVINCLLLVFFFIVGGVPIMILIRGVLANGISALILWPIYTLYRDMRRENIEKPGQVMNSNPVQYQV